MAVSKNVGSEKPDLNDILSSIRKIISDGEKNRKSYHGAQTAHAVTTNSIDTQQEETGFSEKNNEINKFLNGIHKEKDLDYKKEEYPSKNSNSEKKENLGNDEDYSSSGDFDTYSPFASDSTMQKLAKVMSKVSPSQKTVDELVKEAIQPILKNWIDRNLCDLVSQIVEKVVRESIGKR